MELLISEINEGHYQITYRTKNEDNETIYYCLQNCHEDKVRFMRCTQDGEPQSEAWPKENAIIKIELAPGLTKLTKACHKFISNHPNFEGF